MELEWEQSRASTRFSLAVRENIEKGVEYLKAAGNYRPAVEALTHCKKSWFGVWRRI